MEELVIPVFMKIILTIMVAMPGLVAMYLSVKSKAKRREVAFAISCATVAFAVIGAFYILSLDILMGTAGLLACLGSITFAYWIPTRSGLLDGPVATDESTKE